MVSPVGLVFGLLFLVTKKIGRCGKDQNVHFRGEKEGRAKRCGRFRSRGRIIRATVEGSDPEEEEESYELQGLCILNTDKLNTDKVKYG